MSLNLNDLSYDELLELKFRIEKRLEQMGGRCECDNTGKIKQGDEVYFKHPVYDAVHGIVVSINERTVTIVADSGQHWDVAPHLVKKNTSHKKTSKKRGELIVLTKKSR